MAAGDWKNRNIVKCLLENEVSATETDNDGADEVSLEVCPKDEMMHIRKSDQ